LLGVGACCWVTLSASVIPNAGARAAGARGIFSNVMVASQATMP